MRNFFRANIFFKIFLPVTAVTCVALAVMTFLFSTVFETKSINFLSREYCNNLAMIRNLYTEIHFAVIPNSMQLFNDSRIRNFLFAREFQYDVALSGLAEIDRMHTLNKYIHSIYLYNKDFGFLSTLKGYRDSAHSSDLSLKKLLENPTFPLNSMIPRRSYFEGAMEPENLFSYINGSLSQKNGQVKYAFVFNLSESKIRKMLVSDSQENESAFYIVDGAGRFLSHPDPELFNHSSADNEVISRIMERKIPTGSEFVRDREGERWLAVWQDQLELGWRFLYLIPEKKIFAQFISLKNTLFSISAGVLLLSLGLLLFMSIHIQRSLESEKKLADYILGLNEFYSKGLSEKNWYFGLFRFDSISGREKPDGQQSIPSRRHRWLTGSSNSSRKKIYWIYLQDNLYAVLSEQPATCFDDDFFTLRTTAVTQYNSEVTGVYASSACSFDEIPAFFEVLENELQNTCMISWGLCRKIIYEESSRSYMEKKMPAEFDFFPFEQALKTQNFEKALSEAKELQDYLFDKKDYLLFRTSLVQTGLIVAKHFEKKLDPYLVGGMDGWRNSLFKTKQISDFFMLVKILLESAKTVLAFSGGLNQSKITRYIKNYVIANIHDKNLSAALIAGALGLSLNYVRELFKKAEKMSINDYIGLYRIELAKQYLMGTGKTVQEICDVTGFTNYSYFCTYFKKSEGLSPSEFRINTKTAL